MLEDYYKLFDIQRDASEQEIKRAFRKLAFKFHPDTSDAPNANERFYDIRLALSILTNPYSRKIYNEVLDNQNPEINIERAYESEFERVYEDETELDFEHETDPLSDNKEDRNKFWVIVGEHFSASPNAFIAFFGAFVFIYFISQQYIKEFNKDWVETIAHFESTRIDERIREKEPEYLAVGVYTYHVNEQNYLARTDFASRNYNVAKSYEPNREVSLFYDKLNPSDYTYERKEKMPLGLYLSLLFMTFIWMRVCYWFVRISYKHYYK